MTAADDLLHRIETEPALADLLTWPGDFDIERRNPIEPLRLPSGAPVTPIAGDASGGHYFLCGPPGGPRPVLYADSEGCATLVGDDLVEVVTLVAAYPYWRDLLAGHPVAELEELAEAGRPGYAEARARLLALLGLTPPDATAARGRLRAVASRTVPDFLPVALLDGEESELEPLWGGG